MRTRLDAVNTSGVTSLDLYDDIPLSLNYNIADIRNPEKRQTNFSKTIVLPGTKVNNRFFGDTFDVNYSIQTSGTTNFRPDFNPNLQVSGTVYSGDVDVFKGVLQLHRVNVIDYQTGRYEYEVELRGWLSNIFTNMGEKLLTDLNISTWNHTYNRASIVNSWTAAVGTGYVYPMIDYGFANQNGLTWDTTQFYPSVYAREYLAQIFQQSGFQWQSTFLDGDYFKRKIIPFNSDAMRLSAAQIAARLFDVQTGAVTSGTVTTVVANYASSTVTFNAETNDPGNQFDSVSTYKFTATSPGKYSFTTTGTLTAKQFSGTYNFNIRAFIDIVREDANSVLTVLALTPVSVININSSIAFNLTASPITLLAGEKIYVRVWSAQNISYNDYNASITPAWQLAAGTRLYNNVINSGIADGDTVDMNNAMPFNIRQRDYFIALIKMFNLYVEQDVNVPNKLIIEPRDDFYSSGVTRVWTSLVDESRQIQITPMGLLDWRRFIYTYDDDNDYYNDLYKKKFNRTYGDRQLTVNNDFLKETKEQKVIFAATPSAGALSHDRVIPKIYALDQSGNIRSKTSKIRILHYGGVKSTQMTWTFTTATQGSFAHTTYPYAGHLDDPYNPSHDLNFGVVSEIYWDGTWQAINWTDSNLYNRFHALMMSEITDKDSKIVTMFIRLRPADMQILDFRDKYFIDGQFYRLNKIYDYNPTLEGVTKCEFLKFKDGVPFSRSLKLLTGGAAIVNEVPTFATATTDEGTKGDTGGGATTGRGFNTQTLSVGRNYIGSSSQRVIVSGSGNTVGEQCTDVNILSSSGCTVAGGLTNVTIVMSSGITVTESNVYYVNSQKMSANGVLNLSANTTIQREDAGKLILCYPAGGGVPMTITLPQSTDFNSDTGAVFTLKNMIGNILTINVIADSDDLIDKATSYSLNTQYSSLTLKLFGTNWYVI